MLLKTNYGRNGRLTTNNQAVQQNNANSLSQRCETTSPLLIDNPTATQQIFDNGKRFLPNGVVTVSSTSETKDAVGNLKVSSPVKENHEQNSALTNGESFPTEVRFIISCRLGH
jgi:superfamily I DNA and RNA helicase